MALRSVQRVVLGRRVLQLARSYGGYSAPTLWCLALSLATEHGTAGQSALLVSLYLVLTIILIPQSLAIHGFEADQIGPAIIWSAVPLLLVAFTAGLLLLAGWIRGCSLLPGLTCTALAAVLSAQYTSAWAAENYYRTELLIGVGQAFSLIGLVACIILQGVFPGGWRNRSGS